MNRRERRIQKRRVRRAAVMLASIVMLGTTAGLGGSAFGIGRGGGGPGGGSGGGYGTGGGGGGGIAPGDAPGSGSGVNFHGDTCQATGHFALDRNGGAPAIRYGELSFFDGIYTCAFSFG